MIKITHKGASRWLAAAAAAGSVIGGTTAAGIVANNKLRPFFTPRRLPITFFPEQYGLSHEDYEELSIHNPKHKLNLSGWLIKGKSTKNSPSTKAVIFSHGFMQNRSSHEQILNIAKQLREEGIAVILYDFQNHGKSDDGQTTLGIREQEDLKAVIEKTKSLGYTDIGLIGVSMGASVSLAVAAQTPEVKAVIADTPFTDLPTFANEQLTKRIKQYSSKAMPFVSTVLQLKGLNLNSFRPIDAIQKLGKEGVPVKLFHSKGDKITEEHHAHDLAKAYGDPKILQVTQAVEADDPFYTHCRSIETQTSEYIGAIMETFRELDKVPKRQQPTSKRPKKNREISPIYRKLRSKKHEKHEQHKRRFRSPFLTRVREQQHNGRERV